MTDYLLLDAHMRTSADRQARLGAYVARLGEAIGYDSDEFVADAVLVGQADQAAASWAYLSAAGEAFDGEVLGVDLPVDKMIGAATHAGTPLETVYRRPAKLAAELRAAGLPEAEVLKRVGAEVELLASSDVAVSGRKAEQVYLDVDRRVIGSNRVPNAGACEFCRLIAQQDYNLKQLAPAHRGCKCGTAPRFRQVKPGDDIVDEKAVKRYEDSGVPLRRASRKAATSTAEDLGKVLDVAEVVDSPATRGLPAGSSSAADDAYRAQVAERYGITPDELKAAEPRVKAVRQQIRDEAAAVQQEAFDELYKWNDAWSIRRPPRSVADRGGEWDWLEQIDARERARLSRKYYSDTGITIDELPQALGNVDLSVDQAVDEWLRVNRNYEAAGALRRGKLPSTRAYSGRIDVDTLLPGMTDDGYSVKTILGADDITAAADIASAEKGLLVDDALGYLGDRATAPVHGPSPYKMSYQAWEEELRTLEYGLREYPSEMPANARDRLAELVPELLDDGDDYEQLYAKIIDTAHKAGEDVPDYAYIPWN